jgi:hypothetical protein
MLRDFVVAKICGFEFQTGSLTKPLPVVTGISPALINCRPSPASGIGYFNPSSENIFVGPKKGPLFQYQDRHDIDFKPVGRTQ